MWTISGLGAYNPRFSTLQRVEIAEMRGGGGVPPPHRRFSTLQRVEIAEIQARPDAARQIGGFSTLQRVEIAEIDARMLLDAAAVMVSVLFNESKLLKLAVAVAVSALEIWVSVLFNESKLLKFECEKYDDFPFSCFSTLQRVEIAEICAPGRPGCAR